jgi:hypothetical protein
VASPRPALRPSCFSKPRCVVAARAGDRARSPRGTVYLGPASCPRDAELFELDEDGAREHPREQRHWAEAAPAPVRELFLAIRENTPAARRQDETAPMPDRNDPTLPRLDELPPELRHLLEGSWSIWDEAVRTYR